MQGSPFNWKSLLLLSIPPFIYLLILLGEAFSSYLPWFRPWQPVVLVVGGVLIANAIQKRIRLRKAGFKPARRGFSSEVDVLAKRLQDRLQEVDRAIRFERTIEPLPREFGEFAQEVIQTALVVDKKPILPQWKSLQQQDHEIQFQLQPDYKVDPEGRQKSFESYQFAVMQAIEELHLYSQSVKQKGGLYRISKKEFIISSVLIVGFSAAGTFLIWNHWSERGWAFWTGFGAIALAGIIATLLIGVLKDQESTQN